jgi:hypothetical protein
MDFRIIRYRIYSRYCRLFNPISDICNTSSAQSKVPISVSVRYRSSHTGLSVRLCRKVTRVTLDGPVIVEEVWGEGIRYELRVHTHLNNLGCENARHGSCSDKAGGPHTPKNQTTSQQHCKQVLRSQTTLIRIQIRIRLSRTCIQKFKRLLIFYRYMTGENAGVVYFGTVYCHVM